MQNISKTKQKKQLKLQQKFKEKSQKNEESKKILQYLEQKNNEIKQNVDTAQYESILSLSQRRKKIKKQKDKSDKWVDEIEEEIKSEEENKEEQTEQVNIFQMNFEKKVEQKEDIQGEKEINEQDQDLELRVKRAMPSIQFNDFRDYQDDQKQKKREKIFDPNFVYQIEGTEDEEIFYEEKDLLPFLNKQVQQKQAKYRKARDESQQSLPIYEKESELIEAINSNLVTIICGETGSGKSTQLPQLLLEYGYTDSSSGNPGGIGVTQPRRLATCALATRVAQEMKVRLGSQVGYQVRFTKQISKQIRIKFMTDGILMNELASDFLLTTYSVIIVDEAHERKVNSDVLLGFLSRIVQIRLKLSLKELRNTGQNIKYHPLRLIIMSATLQVEQFISNKGLFEQGVPVINISNRQYPVKNYYSKTTPVDYLQAAVSKCLQIHNKLPPGDVLVFLTGQQEVNEVKDMLMRKLNTIQEDGVGDDDDDDFEQEGGDKEEGGGEKEGEEKESINNGQMSYRVLALYSKLDESEQEKVFSKMDIQTTRTFIIATNVAETSITIPNVKYVVDSGKQKSKIYHSGLDIVQYRVSWISCASSKQRLGRAGRTAAGVCYKLYSSAVYANLMAEFTPAEILETPLQNVILQLKSIGVQNVIKFPWVSTPDTACLLDALERLRQLDCLEGGGGSGDGSRLSKLGQVLAYIPLVPRYAKMLLLGRQKGVLGYILLLVAGLSVDELYRADKTGEGQGQGEGQEGQGQGQGKRQKQQGTISDESDNEEENKHNALKFRIEEEKKKKEEKERRLRAYQLQIQAHHKQYNSMQVESSDLFLVMNLIGAFMSEVMGVTSMSGVDKTVFAFSQRHRLIPKSVKEIYSSLHQVLGILESIVSDTREMTAMKGFLGGYVKPDMDQQRLIQNVIIQTFIDKVARKVPYLDESGMKKYVYESSEIQPSVHVPPQSVQYKKGSEYIVYTQIMTTDRHYLMNVSEVTDLGVLKRYDGYEYPVEILNMPVPFFSQKMDKVVVYASSAFGRKGWTLDSFQHHYDKSDVQLYYTFMRLLLEGQVLGFFKATLKLYVYQTKTIKMNNVNLYVTQFVQALKREQVCNRKTLNEQFKKNPQYLMKEFMAWLPKDKQNVLIGKWPPLF